MTLADAVKPSNWSDGWRWFVGSATVVIVTVLSTVGTTGVLIGGYGEKFNQFGNQLNQVLAEQQQVRKDLAKTHDDTKDALSAAAAVAKDLKEGREVNLPRIGALEGQEHVLDSSLQVLGAKLDAQDKKIDAIGQTVGRHDAEINESAVNTRILLDKIAPESSPRLAPFGPHGH